MKKLVLSVAMILAISSAYSQSVDTNSSIIERPFMVKGTLGYSVFPGLFGYMLYMEVPDAMSYCSGFSLNADALYEFNSFISAGLHIASVPIFHMNLSPVSVSIDMIPFDGYVQFETGGNSYFNIGLGLAFVHGYGKSTSSSISFLDTVSGANTGSTFDVMRGPYFNLSYAFGWDFDLSGKKQFGIDFNIRNYHIIGHPGLDAMGKQAEEYAGVPGFLMAVIFNPSIGMYFRF